MKLDLPTERYKVTVTQHPGDDLDLPTERYKATVTQHLGNDFEPTKVVGNGETLKVTLWGIHLLMNGVEMLNIAVCITSLALIHLRSRHC